MIYLPGNDLLPFAESLETGRAAGIKPSSAVAEGGKQAGSGLDSLALIQD